MLSEEGDCVKEAAELFADGIEERRLERFGAGDAVPEEGGEVVVVNDDDFWLSIGRPCRDAAILLLLLDLLDVSIELLRDRLGVGGCC